MKIKVNAPAKINLYLDIVSKRGDGYHNIHSVMQSISLFDTVSIEKLDRPGRHIGLDFDTPSLLCDDSNTAYKAAALFFEAADTVEYHIDISVRKSIPIAAGLAGGSTDGAAVLLILNELYGFPFSVDELCLIGAKIGADVPFCIRQGTLAADGIGDKLYDIGCSMPECTILVAVAGEPVQTPGAYRQLDAEYNDFKDVPDALSPSEKRFASFISDLACGELGGMCSGLYNIFEKVILVKHREASMIKDAFYRHGALGALMSGSGPSVFAVFNDTVKAITARRKMLADGYKVFMCHPVRKTGSR